MANNSIPHLIDPLLVLGEDAADGAATYAVAIGVTQNTEVKIRADVAALQAAQNTHLAKRAAKVAATAAKTTQDSNAKAFIAAATGVLKNYLGSQWAPAWEEAGFLNGTLAMPGTMEERFAQLDTLRAYFIAHPGHENAPLNVTDAQALALYAANSAARAASNQSNTDAAGATDARDTAQWALRRRLGGLRDELSQLLSDTDPRWYAFGFNAPGDPETPGIPEGLSLTPGAAEGTLYVDWDEARRAERYRVWRKIGAGAFEAVATVTDSDALLTGLPLGVAITVQVTALNDAGESVPSATAVVTLSVPLPTPLEIAGLSSAGSNVVAVTYVAGGGAGASSVVVQWRDVNTEPEFTGSATLDPEGQQIGPIIPGGLIEVRTAASNSAGEVFSAVQTIQM